MSPQEILHIENLSRSFPALQTDSTRALSGTPRLRAVDRVSLTIREGETFGLMGESGCGKTTLARCILGLQTPDSGIIRFQGHDLSSLPRAQRKQLRGQMQSVFQDPYASLNPRMTVGQIIAEPLAIHRKGSRQWRKARVGELLEAVDLPADCATRYPDQFSGGQRQRIAIARALALSPKLLIADEPVSALDTTVKRRITRLLSSLKESHQLSMLFISHEAGLVRDLCDRVAVMYRGRLVELAPVRALFEEPQHPYTRLLIQHTVPSQPATVSPVSRGPRPLRIGDLQEHTPGHWVAG